MSEVTDLIADARLYASNANVAGINAMNGAASALGNIGQTISTDPFKTIKLEIKPPEPGDPGEVPAYTGIHFELDDVSNFIGAPPTLSTVAALVLPNDPALPPPDLLYVDPMVPSGMTPDSTLLQGIPSIDALPTPPVMPDLQSEIAGITAPALITVDIPNAPTYVAPEFVGVAPTFDAEMPTDLDATLRAAYGEISPVFAATINAQLDQFLDDKFPDFRAGMAAIEDRLATYLAGGSALSPDVEAALFTRAQDRADGESRRAIQSMFKKGARAGFTIPGPILLSAAVALDQARRDANTKVSVEIYIKQAELEQANLQFAVTQSTSLRKMAIDAALSYHAGMVTLNGQALEYARSIVDAVVKAFDIAARYAETRARIYEADATVYRAKLEGALAEIHAYESTIRALEAKVNVNRSEIEAYTARLNAVRVEADVYRAAVDSVVSLAGLQRIKVELYDSKVKAFTSQVNAFTAQWSGYEAAVRGQTARMEVNVGHSREYESRANAYSAVVRGKTAAVETALSVNKGLIDVFNSRVNAYGALEHAKAEAVTIDVSAYRAQLDAYNAKANAISERSRANVANYDVALRGLIAEANIQLETMKEFHHLDIVRAQGLAQLAEAIGSQYGNLAQAALNGMNTLGASTTSTTT